MQQISSSFTLFLKIIFPTSWFMFFGLFGLGAIFLNDGRNALLASNYFILGYTIFFIVFAIIIYLTCIQIQRVDMDSNYIYITNYFKTYRYDYQSIESISMQNWLVFTTAKITLKEKGKLGQRIHCLIRKKVFLEFVAENRSSFKDLIPPT